ncbi:MAG: 1-deoxy-D-xylulose-5-phosphate synthase, partial [Kiritimatiellae bacterium]|nr:1-deoxy-D-xylulose-5-phosphate synthase [Kiritimatiellia bacterium]
MTAEEIRARILDVVQKNGGHLASSLGAVEISMALAEVFDPGKDRVVWDVGHQAYAWKLLTDRGGKSFDTLRTTDGLAPFPTPAESIADAAVAGHAGVALSVAEGLAAARDARGTDEHVIAVVGDASIVNGTSLEALNNLAASTRKVIVVLNDNKMSISRPVGSLAKLLGRLITSVRYNRVKAAAERTGHRLRLTFLRSVYHRLESRIKSWFLGNAFFEQFGLRYIGPVDGNDLPAVRAALTVAKEDKRSVIVHAVTRKGMGYPPAERDPTAYHGVSPGGLSSGGAAAEARVGWSEAFGS